MMAKASDESESPERIERLFIALTTETLDRADADRSARHRQAYSHLGWTDLLKSDRVLIISQAGSGKTVELH